MSWATRGDVENNDREGQEKRRVGKMWPQPTKVGGSLISNRTYRTAGECQVCSEDPFLFPDFPVQHIDVQGRGTLSKASLYKKDKGRSFDKRCSGASCTCVTYMT